MGGEEGEVGLQGLTRVHRRQPERNKELKQTKRKSGVRKSKNREHPTLKYASALCGNASITDPEIKERTQGAHSVETVHFGGDEIFRRLPKH